MNRTKYLVKNTVVFAIGNIGSKLINFFLIPLFTNYLSTEQYGITDLIFTILSIAVPVIILNINEAIMRFAMDEEADYNKIMSVGMVVIALSVILSIPLYIISWAYTPVSDFRIYIYVYAITYGICEINVFYLRGKEQLLAFSISNMLRTFLIAVFNILFLVVLHLEIPGYLLAFISANVITALYAFFVGHIYGAIRNFKFDKELFERMTRYSLPLIPNSFMWWIIDSSDRIMITTMIAVSVSGIYAVSSKITALISFISTIFNQAYSYSALKEEKSEDRIEFNNKVLDMLFASVTIIGLSVMLIIKVFMRYYVSTDFFDAWYYAPPLIVGTCVLVLATFLSVSYTVNKDSMGFLKSGILGAVINIALNLSLIPLIGALGAAIATCASYIIIFVYRSIDTRKYIRLSIYSKTHIISFIVLGLSALSVYISEELHYGTCIAGIIVAVIIYRNSIRFAGTKLISILKR